ncbi:MAG: hypothetical protein ABI835_17415, partial [Chloroflexota bacterium]
FLVKRLIQAIPLLLVISMLTFGIVEIAPGDATQMYINPERGVDPAYIAQVRLSLGLDQPIYVRYLSWLGVNIELAPLDDAAINTELYANTAVEKPYDAFLGGWGLFGPEPDHYSGYYADDTGFFSYDNAEIADLFTQGAAETDADARAAIYQQADALLWQDLPMIPIFQPIGVYVYRSDLNLDAAEINGTFLTGLKFPSRAYFVQ